jgi:hypothetical protein
MAYTAQTWHDSPATDTPISAARLGVMEAGIAASAVLDANGNLAANGLLPAAATTAIGATITMTIASPTVQYITGSTGTQTILLPTTGVPAGYMVWIVSAVTGYGSVAVKSSSGAAITTLGPSYAGLFVAVAPNPTAANGWVYLAWSLGAGPTFLNAPIFNAGSFQYNFPGAADTLVGLAATQNLSNKTLTAPVLSAGGATVTPLKFNSGAVLTTPAAGAIEYDGTCFYETPVASQREVLLGEQFITQAAPWTIASTTSPQQIFNATTNGTITLPAGVFFFDCQFDMTSMSATSSAFGFQFGGTAVIGRQKWFAEAQKGVTGGGQLAGFYAASAASICIATTATNGWAKITGKLRIDTGGTLIPQVILGAAAAALMSIDSYFRIWQVGGSAVTNVGNWS